MPAALVASSIPGGMHYPRGQSRGVVIVQGAYGADQVENGFGQIRDRFEQVCAGVDQQVAMVFRPPSVWWLETPISMRGRPRWGSFWRIRTSLRRVRPGVGCVN